jgi:hypothetical protein
VGVHRRREGAGQSADRRLAASRPGCSVSPLGRISIVPVRRWFDESLAIHGDQICLAHESSTGAGAVTYHRPMSSRAYTSHMHSSSAERRSP